MTGDDNERAGGYASPPCFMHEVDPAYLGLTDTGGADDLQQRTDVRRWRKAERARLIAQRLTIADDARRRYDDRIAAHLATVLGDADGATVSIYWPIRGEPDLRGFMTNTIARGGHVALPVVARRNEAMVFRTWAPGDRLARGIWNIPVPEDSADVVTPDAVIAPVVGFDRACYRLGNGGGYFDRTLAALNRRPRIIGVGYAQAAIATIYPQPHDIPMDLVVTEDGVVTPAADPNPT
jgi:5,10-methenyltetrahydrofolate synthetase